MKEIAVVLKLILANTEAEEVKADRKPASRSKAKFVIEPAAETEAHHRLFTHLARFPVYPKLDLAILQKHFGCRSCS